MITYTPHLAEGLPYDVDATGTPCEVPARIVGPSPGEVRELLSIGWSQERAAAYLGITRGAVQWVLQCAS